MLNAVKLTTRALSHVVHWPFSRSFGLSCACFVTPTLDAAACRFKASFEGQLLECELFTRLSYPEPSARRLTIPCMVPWIQRLALVPRRDGDLLKREGSLG